MGGGRVPQSGPRSGVTSTPPPRDSTRHGQDMLRWHRRPSLYNIVFYFLPTAYVVRDGRLYFHFVCQSTPWGGGTLARSSWGGGYPVRSSWGVPHPALDRGYPSQVQTGGTPARSRQGYPPWQRME